ncbi:MAG: SDR family oxidoreductase [Lachnospiraceae bacterium]|jgi:dTDP-4-dehydrorhamnose reductase|nr:SDR family oxidoreductase [Lachnospiraceae bacterium]
MLKKYKIYITGIVGLLGYGIYNTLKDRAEITGLDLQDILITGLSYQKISLLDMKSVERDIAKIKPDVLVHTAALVNVDKCEENPKEARILNTDVTEQLAYICQKYEIKMIYISTDAVFDGLNPNLYTEEDTARPINIYGKTKLDGEKAVLKYPDNLVFRTNIYGINVQEKQSFGEWIYDSLITGKTLNMFTDIDFSPILVNELAELIYQSCKKELCGLYHACGTGCITKYEFGIKLNEVFQIGSNTIHPIMSDTVKLKAKRAKHMGMSNNKLCKELQIKISTPEESIRKFFHLIRSRDYNGN